MKSCTYRAIHRLAPEMAVALSTRSHSKMVACLRVALCNRWYVVLADLRGLGDWPHSSHLKLSARCQRMIQLKSWRTSPDSEVVMQKEYARAQLVWVTHEESRLRDANNDSLQSVALLPCWRSQQAACCYQCPTHLLVSKNLQMKNVQICSLSRFPMWWAEVTERQEMSVNAKRRDKKLGVLGTKEPQLTQGTWRSTRIVWSKAHE